MFDANLFNGTLSDLRRLARLEEGPVASAQLPTADALCQKLLRLSGRGELRR